MSIDRAEIAHTANVDPKWRLEMEELHRKLLAGEDSAAEAQMVAMLRGGVPISVRRDR